MKLTYNNYSNKCTLNYNKPFDYIALVDIRRYWPRIEDGQNWYVFKSKYINKEKVFDFKLFRKKYYISFYDGSEQILKKKKFDVEELNNFLTELIQE